MAGLAGPDDEGDEAALGRRAAAGDGDAFAVLYERYESRVYNLCYRILGSRDDAADAAQEAFVNVLRRLPKLEGRELAFGSYVFTCARNASYDLIERRRRTEPSDEIPDSATPLGGGVGGGGLGRDPGDPEQDPERNVLLEARTEEIRAANLELPERQREVLALRELEELSYDEIAEIMEMNRNSVAQLISRARIGLRDSLRGTALASIATSSPQCERALPLIALREDGQLDGSSDDAEWLADHVVGCHTCRLRREAMEEAGVSYRAWLPITAGPLLFRETMAQAAELVGADWSETVERHAATGGGAGRRLLPHRVLDAALVALLALALLLVGMVSATSDDDPPPDAVPVAAEEPQPATTKKEAEPERKADAPAKLGPKLDRDAPAAAPIDEEPTEVVEQTVERPSPTAEPRRRIDRRNRVERNREARDEGGVEGGVTPGPTTEQPPPPPAETTPTDPPPTETTPTDTTPTDPPPDPPPICRDAAGQPIPCPPGSGPPRR